MVLILLLTFLLAGENVNAKPTQANGHSEQQQAASQSPSPAVNDPQPQIDNPANAASSGENKERDAKDDVFKADQLRQNRVIVRATVWIAIFSGLSFLAVLVYAIVSLLQWREIKKQAGHAGEQVGAMQGQLDAIEKQAGIMDESLIETRKLVEQNAMAIEVAEENTRLFEKMAIDTNRAFVTATLDVIEEGFEFHLRIANSGNTPANDVRVYYGFSLREKPPFEKTEEGGLTVDTRYARAEGLGLIAPKSGLILRTPKSGQLSGPDFQRWKLGQIRFYCWGMVSYQDFFSQGRLSWFCFYQAQAEPKGAPYEHGNYAQ